MAPPLLLFLKLSEISLKFHLKFPEISLPFPGVWNFESLGVRCDLSDLSKSRHTIYRGKLKISLRYLVRVPAPWAPPLPLLSLQLLGVTVRTPLRRIRIRIRIRTGFLREVKRIRSESAYSFKIRRIIRRILYEGSPLDIYLHVKSQPLTKNDTSMSNPNL